MNKLNDNFATRRDEWLAADDEALLNCCTLDFFKATGNGGQKRNKTSSAVRIVHTPTGIAVTDCSERSQHRNRKTALEKLRCEIALTVRVLPAVLPENPECGLSNPNYFINLARIFDLLCENSWDDTASAIKLGISRSKLLKLLARNSRTFARLNEFRRQNGLPPLHL